jgi:hypothetical protein
MKDIPLPNSGSANQVDIRVSVRVLWTLHNALDMLPVLRFDTLMVELCYLIVPITVKNH